MWGRKFASSTQKFATFQFYVKLQKVEIKIQTNNRQGDKFYVKNRDSQEVAWRNNSNLLKEKSCYYWSTDSRRCSPSSRRVYAAAAGVVCQSRPRTSCRCRNRNYCQCGSSSSTLHSAYCTRRNAASAWPSSRRADPSRNRAHADKGDEMSREKKGEATRGCRKRKNRKKKKKNKMWITTLSLSPRAHDRTHSNCSHSTLRTLLAFVMVAGGGAWLADQSAGALQDCPSCNACAHWSLSAHNALGTVICSYYAATGRLSVYFENSRFLVNSGENTVKNK